jgi:hypothetical protein
MGALATSFASRDVSRRDAPKPCPKCGAERSMTRSGTSGGGAVRLKAVCQACYRRQTKQRRGQVGHSHSLIWNRANPEKRRAQKMVETALTSGRLERRPCERCGSEPVHAHHDDYSRPLHIMWLCPAHHKERHRELKAMGVDLYQPWDGERAALCWPAREYRPTISADVVARVRLTVQGRTQRETAALLGISQKSVSRILRGEGAHGYSLHHLPFQPRHDLQSLPAEVCRVAFHVDQR